MRTQNSHSPWKLTLSAILILLQIVPGGCIQAATTEEASTQGQLLEQTENFSGTIDFSTDKTSAFQLNGTEPSLGTYTAQGEVTFRAGEAAGTLLGDGVAVFTDTDGDQLVAVVTWPVDPELDGQRAGDIQFHWRDSVTFSDGTVFQSTGKFANAEDRPPGLVVIAIIAVLIGLLVPAVQK